MSLWLKNSVRIRHSVFNYWLCNKLYLLTLSNPFFAPVFSIMVYGNIVSLNHRLGLRINKDPMCKRPIDPGFFFSLYTDRKVTCS